MTDPLCPSNYGHAGDHLAYESMTTPKDSIAALERLGDRQGDSFNVLERSVDNSKAVVAGLITDSSFRNLEQFGLIGVDAAKNAAAITLQAEKLGSAAVLQAEKLAAAAALAAAACCCEIKEKIGADGQATRDLINSIDRDRQSVMLVDAKIELAAAKQTEVMRGILTSLSLGTGK